MKSYNITLVSLLFILLNVNIFVLSQYCDKCGGLGAECGEGGVVCGNDYVCAPRNGSTLKEALVYTCQVPSSKGQYCINDDNCEVGLACQINKCDNLKFAQLGEKCTRNEECAYDQAVCLTGVCDRARNKLDCVNNYDCDYGNSCVNQVCIKVGLLGEKCNATITQYSTCVFGLVCTDDNKCTNAFTQDENDFCNDDTYCKSGLYCDANKCTKYISPSSNSCSNTTSCDAYHTCSCTDNKCYQSSPLPTQLSEFADPYLRCAVQHKCHPVRNMFSPNSCLSKNCNELLCSYTMSQVLEGPLECGNTYTQDKLCAPNSSTKLTYSVLSIFILLFVYILI